MYPSADWEQVRRSPQLLPPGQAPRLWLFLPRFPRSWLRSPPGLHGICRRRYYSWFPRPAAWSRIPLPPGNTPCAFSSGAAYSPPAPWWNAPCAACLSGEGKVQGAVGILRGPTAGIAALSRQIVEERLLVQLGYQGVHNSILDIHGGGVNSAVPV